jgi:alpha-1,2-mannosyltransferase
LRLHADTKLTDWTPYLPMPGEKLISQILTGLIFLIAGAACVRRPTWAAAQRESDPAKRRNLQYLLVICLCLVSSPLTWSHYYVWLLIPMAFFLGSQLSFPSSQAARGFGWAAVLLVTPLVEWPWSISNPGLMTMYRSFAISHLLFGGLLWFGLVAWRLARSSGLLSPSAAPSGVTPQFELFALVS